MLGVTSVATISFLDDLKPRPALLRFMVHAVAVLLMFYQIPLFDWPLWLLLVALIVCIGTISAFNFMDGINGITGVYGLVSLGSFAFVNVYIVSFTDDVLILALGLAMLVFLFFNFRKFATCFAGDVGSVTIAYVQIFFLLQLIHKTNNFYWVLIFLVYGLDSVITIVYRIRNNENIFKAHRTHLYQYLSNEMGMSHRFVSVLYGGVQLVINSILIINLQFGTLIPVFSLIAVTLVLYFLFRSHVVRGIARKQNE